MSYCCMFHSWHQTYMILDVHFAVMKVDAVCLQTLMQTTAMHWVMVLELSFIPERPG